jgi:hypothetical protein
MAANTNANQTDQFWVGVGQQQYHLTSTSNHQHMLNNQVACKLKIHRVDEEEGGGKEEVVGESHV